MRLRSGDERQMRRPMVASAAAGAVAVPHCLLAVVVAAAPLGAARGGGGWTRAPVCLLCGWMVGTMTADSSTMPSYRPLPTSPPTGPHQRAQLHLPNTCDPAPSAPRCRATSPGAAASLLPPAAAPAAPAPRFLLLPCRPGCFRPRSPLLPSRCSSGRESAAWGVGSPGPDGARAADGDGGGAAGRRKMRRSRWWWRRRAAGACPLLSGRAGG